MQNRALFESIVKNSFFYIMLLACLFICLLNASNRFLNLFFILRLTKEPYPFRPLVHPLIFASAQLKTYVTTFIVVVAIFAYFHLALILIFSLFGALFCVCLALRHGNAFMRSVLLACNYSL
jgi:hypothetical protein